MKEKENDVERVIDLLDTAELSARYKMKVDKSLDYLFSHRLQAMSNEVPDELLSWWVMEWEVGDGKSEPQDYRIIEVEDDTDTNSSEYDEQAVTYYENLSVFGRVFLSVMFSRNRKDPTYFERTKDLDPRSVFRAAEFVRYVQLARKENRIIPDFDIFDIERYDEIVEQLYGK